MNMQLEVKLTPEIETAIYNQNLPMPIYLKEDLTNELALIHIYGIVTVLPLLKCVAPFLHTGNPTEN